MPEDQAGAGADLRPMPGHMLVELRRRDKEISLIRGIVDTVESVPASTRAVVIRFGRLARDPGFSVGDSVEVTPQAGSFVETPEEAGIQRMIVPVSAAFGVWEG